MWLVAAHDGAAESARELAPFAEVIVEPFGDIWLRDTGPIVLGSGSARRAQGFGFNGWGGKYDLTGDEDIGERLARDAGLPFAKAGLGPRGRRDRRRRLRHRAHDRAMPAQPQPQRADPRARSSSGCCDDLGFERVVWLGSGLLNDHTDGHVDNLARFVAPGRRRDPDGGEGRSQRGGLQGCRAAAGATHASTSSRCPRPAGSLDEDGDVIPASYMNFYIGNAAVVVPQYGAPNDRAAVDVVQALFPDRVAIGLRADHILTGGGSFHCISQQVPA